MISLKSLISESMDLPFKLITNGVGDFYIKLDGSNGGEPLLDKPTSGNYAAVTTNKEILDSKYLYYVVLNLHNLGKFKYLQQGTTVPHITLPNIKKTIVKFFSEQPKSK